MKARNVLPIVLLIWTFTYFAYYAEKPFIATKSKFVPKLTKYFHVTANEIYATTKKSEKVTLSNKSKEEDKEVEIRTDFKSRKNHVEEYCKRKHLANRFPCKFLHLFITLVIQCNEFATQ